uniref:Salivary secreted peptide n=1 Tax=Anopheles maculatus TaxID=74869 RepID=A0A182SCI0_9DIPT
MKCFPVLILFFSLLTIISAAPVAEAEKEQTTAAPEAKDDSQKESVQTPNVKTDDSPRDKPDMSPVDFMQQVITNATLYPTLFCSTLSALIRNQRNVVWNATIYFLNS